VWHCGSCWRRGDVGPGRGWVLLYQYAVEQHADTWWIRGWYKSKDVTGRGLQLRVKCTSNPNPQQVFYMDGRGTSGWTYFSFVTDVLRKDDSTDLGFELDGSGTVWLDDVAISALKDGASPKTTAFPLPKDLAPRPDVLIDLPMTAKPGRGVYDASHNGHHLMLVGDPQWLTEDGRSFLRLDGIDDAGTITGGAALEALIFRCRGLPIKTLFPKKAFTYEFWIRPRPPKDNPRREMLVFHYRWNPVARLHDYRDQDKTFAFDYQNDRRRPQDTSRAGEQLRLTTRVPAHQWLHMVATHGDGKMILYVNGKAVGQTDYNRNNPGFEFFNWQPRYSIGRQEKHQSWFCGDLGPFRLHAKALSAAEVTKLHKTGWPKQSPQ